MKPWCANLIQRTLNTNKLLRVCVIALVVSPLVGTAQNKEPLVSSSSNQAADWQMYTVDGEEFSVLLPVKPAMTTTSRHLEKFKKDRRERILGAYADGVVYFIYTFENPRRRQSLDELMAESYKYETVRDITKDGFNGKEYSRQTADFIGVTQFYITDKNIYIFGAAGYPPGNPEIGIPKFLSSLTFAKEREGTKVVDGPGEQPLAAPANPDNQNEDVAFNGKLVNRKARVMTKPEPAYTESARREQIEGTVVLRAIFSSSGAVTNIRTVSGLSEGLTDKAIGAARQIRFIPAIKDGHFVSMYIQLEYNFNLY